MPDDEIALCNACTDLVGLKKSEGFPRYLLGSKRPGEWIAVRECCQQFGLAPGALKAELFAAWLPDPLAAAGYAVILFYDDESKWSMAAHYNRARLLGGAASNQALQPTGAAVPLSPDSLSPGAAPVAEL